jgi:beta-glucosidase
VHGDILQANQDNAIPTTDGLDNVRRAVDLTAGPHAIEITTGLDTSAAPVQVRLNWYTPEQRKADHEAAIAAAKNAKVAVVFLWTRLNPVFGLPGEQNKLVEDIAAVNPNTIVVLNTSQPVALPWVDKVKAVLEMWWPGDEGGWSTANLLPARPAPPAVCPSPGARASRTIQPPIQNIPSARTRASTERPRTAKASTLAIAGSTRKMHRTALCLRSRPQLHHICVLGPAVERASDGGIDVQVHIKNTGDADSDEVPQVYLGAPSEIPPNVQFPVRALVAFDRIHLAAGESKTVKLHVAPRQLQYWSAAETKWLKPNGKRIVSVGSSSRDLRLNQTVE